MDPLLQPREGGHGDGHDPVRIFRIRHHASHHRQSDRGGNQSGLDNFIFGQAASMVRKDVYTMLGVALLVMLVVIIAFKEWKLFLFDADFAAGLGLSGRLMNAVYLTVLVLVIVIGIQAVGVILMAALLIIPSVSARYWTHSFKWMMILSALFGGGSGLFGTFISTLGKGWPTGPFIVVASSSLFIVSLVFGAQKGLLIKSLQLRAQKKLLTRSWSGQDSKARARGGELA